MHHRQVLRLVAARPGLVSFLVLGLDLCLSFLPTVVLAATKPGVVVGAVQDDVGGPLPGARVEITGRSHIETTRSGGMGFFHFPGLVAGRYTITVSYQGFVPVAQEVLVRSGETTTMSVQLGVPKKSVG